MKLAGLRDPQNRDRFLLQIEKRLRQIFRTRRPCKPVFVFGRQRSGTTMFMHALHRHPEAMVWDEHRDNRAFLGYRVRHLDVIREIVNESRFPIACFKPICDSHLIAEFVAAFPEAHHLWLYRHFEDVANSALRRFDAPTRAIRLVCTGQPGGGWFAEGVSAASRGILAGVYHQALTEFDLSCLVWWARNRIIVESGLLGSPSVTLIRYESLVLNPESVCRWLFARMGLPYHDRMITHMNDRSIGRDPAPPIDGGVHDLCSSLLRELDAAFDSQKPLVSASPA